MIEDLRLLVVSHCNFEGNSSYHALAFAREAHARGVTAALAIPDRPDTIEIVGPQPFAVITYDDVVAGRVFNDGAKVDLVHAFTPRDHVRKVTEAGCALYGARYIVHLEDNERAIVEDETQTDFDELARLPFEISDRIVKPWRTHPVRGEAFLHEAAGFSAVIDALLEDRDEPVPRRVVWPGFDEQALSLADAASARSRLGLRDDELVLAYTGNIHDSNLGEVQSLYLAIAILRRNGHRVRLLKTGWNHVDMSWVASSGALPYVTDIGFVSREEVWDVIAAADVLVQPGSAGAFNDYRFPSKLPDFLVSGKPVVLPRSNIGKLLADGRECIVLATGDAEEIAGAVARLVEDPSLAASIGAGGRAFAEANLRWSLVGDRLTELYEEVREAPPTKRSPKPLQDPPAKLLAFYLPQFHPIPENDEWWGEGFTEWTNVRRGRPMFTGHHQPQLPVGNDFYDLRDPAVMERQAAVARSFGLYGFCYYYYWFNGQRILERPIDQMLSSGRPDFPFCLCWANENWTRRWDGLDDDVLLEQRFESGWHLRFIEDLAPALKDPRYITVRGKPLLLIYRANLIPNVQGVVADWHSFCRAELGADLHLSAVQSFGIADPRTYGMDSAVEFPPHTERFLLERTAVADLDPSFEGYLEDYLQVMRHQLTRPLPEYEWFRGVMPAWDNTARRKEQAHILVGSSPDLYRQWLERIIVQTILRARVDEPLVFINAWNEWAEGTHLEPDTRYGNAWLDTTREALLGGTQRAFELTGAPLTAAGTQEYVTYTLPALSGAPVLPAATREQPVRIEAASNRRLSIRRPVRSMTSDWFSNSELDHIATRYRNHGASRHVGLSYATVGDFVDSWEHLNPLATAQGDLKDVQRPWAVKTILGNVSPGGRLLEIGAGQPFVADLLSRLGYEVFVVDPYDGSGNGPREYEEFRAHSPEVTFVRNEFGPDLPGVAESSFDCIYSISVLEHVSFEGLDDVLKGMSRFLVPDGLSVHAVDHVHRGNGAPEHFEKLAYLTGLFGLDGLTEVLDAADEDTETYYLSAESHNRWRGNTPYSEFPMRVCISVHGTSRRSDFRGP